MRKIDQFVTIILGGCFGPVRLDGVRESIGGVVAVGEAHLEWDGWVAHELGAAGHDGVRVRVRMAVCE